MVGRHVDLRGGWQVHREVMKAAPAAAAARAGFVLIAPPATGNRLLKQRHAHLA